MLSEYYCDGDDDIIAVSSEVPKEGYSAILLADHSCSHESTCNFQL